MSETPDLLQALKDSLRVHRDPDPYDDFLTCPRCARVYRGSVFAEHTQEQCDSNRAEVSS